MSALTITHAPGDGTLLVGDPRPHHDLIKARGLRWSRNLGSWYVPRSRDTRPDTTLIEGLAADLRGAGFDVDVEVEDGRRSTAEVEADRAARAEDRVERLGERAERLDQQATDRNATAQRMGDAIPFGQPTMPDHYSYGRDVRYRERMRANYEKGFQLAKEARNTARRADGAAATQRHREDGATTLRRIDKLEAEQRALLRRWDEEVDNDHLRACHPELADHLLSPIRDMDVRRCWFDRMADELESLDDQLAYWRGHIAALTESGEFRIWGPADFVKGDRVASCRNGKPDCTVKRVNAKTLTVVPDTFAHTSITWALKYDSVYGREREDA